MSKYILVFVVVVAGISLVAFFPAPAKQATIKVAAYNIRYDNPKDLDDMWESRNVILEKSLRKNDFDIFGTQEPRLHQMEDMLVYLEKDYDFIGNSVVGDPTVYGQAFNAIFYKKDRFEVLDEGIFWLSETPETPGSKGWDSQNVRMAVWALFKDRKTDKEFYSFNMHFDHKGKEARVESAKLIVNKITRIAGNTPAIITGDFNSNQSSAAYKILSLTLDDSYNVALKRINENWPTLNRFNFMDKPTEDDRRIDHVFVKGGVVKSWELVNDSYEKKYPSDHFPVVIDWLL